MGQPEEDNFAKEVEGRCAQCEEWKNMGKVSLSPEEAEILEKLAAIADGSIDLRRGVQERLKPAWGTPVDDELYAVGLEFGAMSKLFRSGCMPIAIGFVPILAVDLHRLRKVVSSSASPVVPTVAPPEHTLQTPVDISVGLLVTMVDPLYKNVKSDVKAMLEI